MYIFNKNRKDRLAWDKRVYKDCGLFSNNDEDFDVQIM